MRTKRVIAAAAASLIAATGLVADGSSWEAGEVEVFDQLPDDTQVLPGHGPATTVAQERATNPYLRQANADR